MDDKCHDDGNDDDGEDDDVHEKNVNIRVGPGGTFANNGLARATSHAHAYYP